MFGRNPIRLILAAATLGLCAHGAADTTIGTDPFTINGTPPVLVHFSGFTGPAAFQAVYRTQADGPDLYFECRAGTPDPSRPIGQMQSYNLWTHEPVSIGVNAALAVVTIDGPLIHLTDGMGVRGDFNRDGVLSVQDIFDFLATSPPPNGIFDFLTAYFQG